VDPPRPLATGSGVAPRTSVDARPHPIARLWASATAPQAYPPNAADLRTVSVLGVALPVRATLALVVVSIVTLLDHEGTFERWFWDGSGGDAALLRSRAISRAVVLGLGSLAMIVLVFRDHPRRYGVRVGDWRAGVAIGLTGAVLMTPIVFAVGLLPSFRDYYLGAATASPLDVVLTTGIEVIPAELFFRGLLMFSLIRVMGPLGIVVAQLPFAFGHIGKPEIETLSTLFGGFLYGWLDWRSGSVLWSGLTHTYILSLAILVSGAMAGG
jgi:membrane protease YdiL (CAAX protease family)